MVERGKIFEFARALQITAPEMGGSPEYPGPLLAPPTYATVISHWGTANREQLLELGFDPERVLHGEENYRFPAGPLREGDRLEGETRFLGEEEIEGRRGKMRKARFLTEARDVETGRTRLLIERIVFEVGK